MSAFNQRDRSLDFLKGVLMYIVVFGHAVQMLMYKGLGTDFYADRIFKAIYTWHMPLFMAVAGFLSWRSIVRKTAGALIINRVQTLIIPMVVWTTLVHGALMLLALPSLKPDAMAGYLHSVFWELWFIWALFVSIVLTAAIHRLKDSTGAMYMLATVGVLAAPEVWLASSIKYTFPFFLLGCLAAAKNIPALLERYRVAVLLAATILYLVCYRAWKTGAYYYVSGSDFLHDLSPELVIRYSAGVTGSIVVYLAAQAVFRVLPFRATSPLEWLGRESICVYLIQGHLFVALSLLDWSWSTQFPPVFQYGLFAVLAGAICAGILLVARVIGRIPLLARILFGRREAPRPVAHLPQPEHAVT